MALAADRDAIAREYATDFRTTFETAAPTLARARGDGLGRGAATLETYLTLLAAAPDTHISRKLGSAAAATVQAQAGAVVAAGGVPRAAAPAPSPALDRSLRDPP